MDPIRRGSSSFDFSQDGSDLPLQVVQVAVVLDNIIGEPAFVFQAHLRIDVFLSRCGVELIALLQAAYLGFDGASHQNNRSQGILQIAFKQQRDFVDDDFVSGRIMLANALFGESADSRVNDHFEFFSGFRMIEDDGAEFLPVEGLIGLQHVSAERVDNFLPSVASRFDDFAG